MSRRVMAYQRPCHEGDEWTCLGCDRVQCNRCDGTAGEELLCWGCFDVEGDGGEVA
jgi:hypothetical protein